MSNVSVTDTVYNITVAETDTSVTVSSGDAIKVLVDTFTISTQVNNTGSGAEIGKDILGDTLFLRSLVAGSGITITENTDDITIGYTNTAGYITDYTVTEADVTGHQSALSITESQISDLQSYITGYTVTEADVTGHQSALSITESQISDLQSYITDYTVTQADVTAHQAALSITESQISDLTAHFSGSYTDLTNKPTIPTNNNELTNGAGYITTYDPTEADITEHQAALSITQSQITDLDHYTNTDWDTQLATKSTDDVTEGSNNLYYTQVRADNAILNYTGNIGSASQGINTILGEQATFTTGNIGDLYATTIGSEGTNLTIDPNGFLHVDTTNVYVGSLTQSVHITDTEVKGFGSTTITFTGDLTGDVTGTVSDISNHSTTDLSEGTNLYYTDTRARTAVSLTTSNANELSYDNTTGVFTYVSPTSIASTGQVVFDVRNASGVDIARGDAVYIAGHSGGKVLVAKADANAAGEHPAVGLANSAMINNTDGSVLTHGEMLNVDTSAFATNDVLYLSETAGELTATRPSSPSTAVQNIGKVARSDNQNGIIIVSGSGRENDVPNLATGTVFIGNGSGYDKRALTTADVSEGANLYYTDARVQTKLGSVSGHILPDNTVGTTDLGSATNNWGRIYGDQLYVDEFYALNGNNRLTVQGHIIPTGNKLWDLGSPNNQFRSAYIGPGSLYIDGQKVIGSDATGDIDITTDSGQNLNISSGADIKFIPQTGETDQGFVVELDRVELGVDADSTITLNGTSEIPDLHVGDLEIDPTLINNTGTNQNLEIRTNGTGYLHANVADMYVGPLTGAVKIDENSISATAGTLTVTGNLTGDVTGTVSDISNHSTTDLTEGNNLYHTDARAITAVQNEATLDLTGDVSIAEDLDVSGLIKINDGFTLGSFDPYGPAGLPSTAMPTSIMGVGQESGWAALSIRSRGEHAWGLTGYGIPNEKPRALLALSGGRLDGSSDDYLNDADNFGSILFNPYSGYKTGTEWLTPSAYVEAIATEDHSSSGMGTKLVINTTENGNQAGATDASHTNASITIQGTTLSTSDTLKLVDDVIITGTTELQGNLSSNGSELTVVDNLKVKGSGSSNTVIGDSIIAGLFDTHGFKVNADETNWAGITLEEYVGGSGKPVDSFPNATLAAQVFGGTPSAKSNVVSGKRLLTLQGLAANQSDGTLPATANFRVKGETTEDQTTSNRGTKLSFETTANGSNSTTETLKLQGNRIDVNTGGNGVIGSGGSLILATGVIAEQSFQVDGNATLNGNVTLGNANTDVITSTGKLKASNGFKNTVLDTATANYLSGVLGIVETGDQAYISDGNGGSSSPCMAFFDGSNWKKFHSPADNISSS